MRAISTYTHPKYDQSVWLNKKVKQLFLIGWHQCDDGIKLLSRHPTNGYLNNRCTAWFEACAGITSLKKCRPLFLLPTSDYCFRMNDTSSSQPKFLDATGKDDFIFSFLIAFFQGESDLIYMIDILHRSVIVFYGIYSCWALALTGKWL